MSIITGYNETAKIVHPTTISKAYNIAVRQNKYTVVLQQYGEWWDFKSDDSELLAKLPLGISDWFDQLPHDIKTRGCTYQCPFSIDVEWVRTHTRQGKEYAKPYWRTSNTHMGMLSMSVNPNVKFIVNVQFINGDRYHLGRYDVRKVINGRAGLGSLEGAVIYNPAKETDRIYWTSARALEENFDPCIVLLSDAESAHRLLGLINDLILPVLHAQNSTLAFYPEISHQIKRSRTELLQAYRTVFETAYAKGKLLQILPTISQFQKAIIEALTQTVNTPTPSSMGGTEVCESILEIINEFVKTLYGLDAEIPKLL